MKKLTAMVLLFVYTISLLGCAGSKEPVWDWAQGLTQGDILTITPWHHVQEYTDSEPLSDAEVLEFVILLNKLTKKNFTRNKKGVGITPETGIQIELTSGTCYINYAPSPYGKHGMLEIGFLGDEEDPYWIDSEDLLDFFVDVTQSKPKE